MIRVSLKLMVGMLLTGCTVNTYHSTSYDPQFRKETTVTQNILLGSIATEDKIEVKEPAPPTRNVVGNTRIKPECGVYRPPTVPDPIKVDFSDLDKAQSAAEINEVALANVKALHQQIRAIQAQQQKSYEDYVKRCVVR